jgi:protein-disulfide isomerase/uncharacterized membrane protein
MSTQPASFYKNASIGKQFLLGILAFLMIGFSLYLTQHYFSVIYPSGLQGGSLCDVNGFFNCDATTLSPLSNIAGVPISLFGMLMGIFLFVPFIFHSEKTEGTAYFLVLVNAIGCFVLFLYSLIALGTLCPFCTLYYVASWVTFFLFFKAKGPNKPAPLILLIYAVIALIPSLYILNDNNKKDEQLSKIGKSLIKQYNELPRLGYPQKELPFHLLKSTEKFLDAPIKIVVYSDFQCPACKALNSVLHSIKKRYKGKANIQYSFYPLDVECNSQMKRPLHDYACKAAYLASCLPEKFSEIHDLVFENQNQLSDKWLMDLAKKHNVVACYKDPKTKEKVVEIVNASDKFNIRSTPTLFINQVKIEGVLPVDQMSIILDEVLRNAKK